MWFNISDFFFCLLSSPTFTINPKGSKIFQLLRLHEAALAFMKNGVAGQGDFFFLGKHTHMHGSKLTVFDMSRPKNVPVGQSALCKYGGDTSSQTNYTIAVCTLIVATVWTVYSGFCIVDLPEHHLLCVCVWDSFLPFFSFSVLTNSPLPPAPSSRGKQTPSVFVCLFCFFKSGHFHLKCAGCDPLPPPLWV